MKCTIPNCEKKYYVKELCLHHYNLNRRHGTPYHTSKKSAKNKYSSMLESYQDRIKINAENGCWEWQGALIRGYGTVSFNHEKMYCHRFSYQHHLGLIPEGMVVCHHCDNRLCSNPKHLFLGTQKDNIQDMIKKKRRIFPQGADCYKSKLTNEIVLQIRSKVHSIEDMKDLALKYNVHYNTIREAYHGNTWRYLA